MYFLGPQFEPPGFQMQKLKVQNNNLKAKSKKNNTTINIEFNYTEIIQEVKKPLKNCLLIIKDSWLGDIVKWLIL